MVDPSVHPMAYWEFDAEVLVITHATTIGIGYQSVVHTGVTRQAAQIVEMNTDVLRSGARSVSQPQNNKQRHMPICVQPPFSIDCVVELSCLVV
jgi:GTPase